MNTMELDHKSFAWTAILWVLCLTAWLISGCSVANDLVALVQTRTPTPTETPSPTATPTRVPTATVTPARRPTNTPTAVPMPNLSTATITLKDLPPGFEALDQADVSKLGLSDTAMAGAFGSPSQAKLQNSFMFLASGSQKMDIIMGLLLYPLSALDKASFDSAIANPDTLLKGLALGMGTNATLVKSAAVLPGMDKFGDRSTGITFALANAAPALRMDVIIMRRGPVEAMLYSVYTNGTKSAVSIAELVRKWDSRLAAALSAH